MDIFKVSSGIYVQGPIIIDEKRLAELDTIILKVKALVVSETEDKVDAEIKKELEDNNHPEDEENIKARIKRYYKNEFSLSIKIDEHRSVFVGSFDEAASNANVINSNPEGFDLEINGVTSVDLTLSNSLYLRIFPNDSQVAYKIFGLFLPWIDGVKPPLHRAFLNMIFPMQWFLLLSIIMLLFLSWGFKSVPTNEISLIHLSAQEILKDGVSQAETSEALEVLLELELKKNDREKKFVNPPKLFWAISFFLLIICILSSAKPITALSLGVGRKKVKRILFFEKALLVSFPLLILTGMIFPFINSFLLAS